MSKYLLCQIFYTLPYGMLPIILIENVTRTRDFVSSENAEYFPIPRIFPKGTLGMYPTKSMHNDDNGAATPSIWMSVEGEDSTTLSFHGVDFEISLRATTHRFCWFMGWIPHKSTSTTNIPKKNSKRVNHSSYTKPEYEQFAYALAHKDYYRVTMATLKNKK